MGIETEGLDPGYMLGVPDCHNCELARGCDKPSYNRWPAMRAKPKKTHDRLGACKDYQPIRRTLC